MACLLPVTAHAKAQVSPDDYEILNAETITTQPVQVAANTNATNPADFQGRFALPYEVRCKGKSLKSGEYLVSVKSEGAARVVIPTTGRQAVVILINQQHALIYRCLDD